MKRLKIGILLLALLTGGLNSAAAAADRIDWHTYDAGMARSRFEKKKVFLFFYAEWCAYCRDMDHKTFTDPSVIRTLNRNFIPIRVGSDRDQAAAALFKLLGIQGMQRSVLVLMHAMPSAVSLIVVSERYEFHPDLIASLVLVSSLLAVLHLNVGSTCCWLCKARGSFKQCCSAPDIPLTSQPFQCHARNTT